jgi:hypothetical protein
MDIMGSSSLSRKLIFDQIRQVWVKVTPEEQVRQQWLKRMVDQLDYPRELLVVEKGIKELPHITSSEAPDRRLDILCYGRGIHPDHALFPLILIECKEGRLTESAVNQAIGYNYHVGAFFAAVVNLDEVRLGYLDKFENKYMFCSFLPSFKELIQWVKR